MSLPERKSHYDSATGATAVWVYAGDFYVTARADVFLTTVLGSCIAVCIRDPVTKCGGMNHFLLPKGDPLHSDFPSLALRYGSYSIERLINAIVTRGGARERLEVKAFGGANVLNQTNEIGTRNVEFVESYFAREGLRLVASDLRGGFARKLRYYPATGRAQVAEVKDSEATAAFLAERNLANGLGDAQVVGEVEVF